MSICVLEFGCVSIFSLASIFANEFLHLFTSVPRRRAYVRLYCRRAYVRQPPLEGRRPGRGPTDIFRGQLLPSPNLYMSFGGWQLPNDRFYKSEAPASYRTHSRCPWGRIPGASRAFGDRLAGIVCHGPNLLVVPRVQRRAGPPCARRDMLVGTWISALLSTWLLSAGGQTSRRRCEEYGQSEVAQGDQ